MPSFPYQPPSSNQSNEQDLIDLGDGVKMDRNNGYVYYSDVKGINAGTISQYDYAVRRDLAGYDSQFEGTVGEKNIATLQQKYGIYDPDTLAKSRMSDQALARSAATITIIPDNPPTGGGNGGTGGNDDSVNPPGQDKSTKTRIPGTSSEFLSMPDLNKAINDEIKRLTMSIIEDSKDLILSKTVNYKSIDFFPESEVQIIPPKKQIKFIRDQFNEIVGAVQKNINKSKKAYSTYNYVEYLDFFEVQYNNSDGKPIVKFKIDLQDFNLDELSVVNLRRIG